MKKKYEEPCQSCGAVRWGKFNEHFDFSGNNVITFECQGCGHLQTEMEFLLKGEKTSESRSD